LASDATSREIDIESYAQTHLRRNFGLLGADYGVFMLGMAFASMATIVPAFAERLGASNLAIGAIPSILTLGYALPPIFFSNHTERLSRKLPFVLKWTVFERLPLLALAAVAYFMAAVSPALALISLFVSLAALSGVGGALMPAWMDVISKVIPTRLRGRLFALGNVIGSGLGLGGAAISCWFLVAFPYPVSYALCFASGFACLVVSFVFLVLVAEPPLASNKEHISTLRYLAQLPEVLRRDRDFTWYLVARCLGPFGSLATGFFTVFALKSLGAPEYEVARFTLVLLATQAVANLAFGYLADHVGHKPVLVAGAVGLLVGNVLALGCTSVQQVYLLFVCVGIGNAAASVSAMNFVLEFAPESDRPTYIGLASTVIAPFAFVAPLVGGLLADLAGYNAIFAVAAVAAVANVALLAARVRDPRRATARAETTLS
jgi:MFS family permease